MTVLDEKMGFWVHMTASGNLTVTGYPPVSTTIPLSTVVLSGWNLVGYPSRTALTLPGDLAGHFTLIYAYHAGDFRRSLEAVRQRCAFLVNDLPSLTATWGYWIQVSSPLSWTVTY